MDQEGWGSEVEDELEGVLFNVLVAASFDFLPLVRLEDTELS